jgi:5,10-methylenetetrahydromethanopterin reductase
MPDATPQELASLAALAETHGYGRVWVYDEGLAMRDCYVTMAAIALRTERVDIGTGITNPYTRHPATTATAVATLQELSGGRAFLGLGAGGSLTLGPLATDRSHPLRATRDTLVACRSLLCGETVSMQASHFALSHARLDFATPTPIWLAGRGEKMLALGGELADGVMLDFLHVDFFADAIAHVRNGAAKSGNQPKLCYSTMVVTSDEEVEATKAHLTYRIVDSTPKVKEHLRITPEDVDAMRAAMAHGLEAAAELVKTEWVYPFVIAGNPEECATQLRSIVASHGLDEFQIPVIDLSDAPRLIPLVAGIVDAARA